MSDARQENQLRRDVRSLMKLPEFRRLMAHLDSFLCGQTYVKGDPTETAFREGKRWVPGHIRHLGSAPFLNETKEPPKEV